MTDDDVLAHRRLWEHIPWVVNGSATPEQRREIEAHLPGCVDCSDELALQARIHAAMNGEVAGGDAHGSLARLFERIDAPANPHGLDRYDGIDEESAAGVTNVRSRRSFWRAGIAALLVAQSAGLAVLGDQLQQRTAVVDAPAADYQTLSRSETASPVATIRFVPAPELTVQDLQAMLDAAGVRIVDSRARSAIYGLAPISTEAAQRHAISAAAIALLHGKAGVLLVEPIATAPEPSQP